ncbi:MAG TPA: hypothetical protein VIU86_18715 [Gaiellaceae bacterium]
MSVLRPIAAWLAWWVALFWLFLLLAGDWNRIEWIGAACVGVVGATLAERLRRAAGVRPRVPLRLLRSVPTIPAIVLADFGILVWALATSIARRRVVRGSFRARSFDPGEGDDGVARRACTVLLAGYSPNAYVVDIDPEYGEVLVHDLVPWRRSEEPA